MQMTIQLEQEEDGRWIAEVPELPGTLAYGKTREEAVRRVQALAFRVIADRLEQGEPLPPMADVFKVVVPVKPAGTLEQLLAQVTEQNLHDEQEIGPAVGKEAWE